MSKTTPTWLFDLDNTLHWADAGIFQLINHKMTAYLSEHLGLSLEEASFLREDYWSQYGATVAGLKKHHPHIDLMDFLEKSHPLDEFNQFLSIEENLAVSLSCLKGRKTIFSNGPSYYIAHLLQVLNIGQYFDAYVGCDQLNFYYKPHMASYALALDYLKVAPGQIMMVDDSLDNLIAAKTMGMTTFWFQNTQETHPSVDYVVASIAQLIAIQDDFI